MRDPRDAEVLLSVLSIFMGLYDLLTGCENLSLFLEKPTPKTLIQKLCLIETDNQQSRQSVTKYREQEDILPIQRDCLERGPA